MPCTPSGHLKLEAGGSLCHDSQATGSHAPNATSRQKERVTLLKKRRRVSRDLWSHWTKDSTEFDWEAASTLERASKHVYNSTCVKCHENLFPATLTREGSDAHLYYKQMTEKGEDLQCISCHLNAGHYIKDYVHGSNKGFGLARNAARYYLYPPRHCHLIRLILQSRFPDQV